MYRRSLIPQALTDLADSQGGLVTTAQVAASGVTAESLRGLLDRGAWTTIARGIHAARPFGGDWLDQAWAGVLVGGPGSALGGVAAAHVFGFADPTTPIDIWVPGTTRPSRVETPWRFRRGVRRSRGSPPRTSIEETVLDLCAGADADQQSHWISRVLRDRQTTAQRLSRELTHAPRLKGRQQVAELLEAIAGGSESPLEVRYLRDVERAHGLPAGVRQRSVSRRSRSDVVYDSYSTIVELDGELGHRGRGETRDAWRDAHHLTLGLVTLRFGWSDLVLRACDVAATVSAVLTARGWQGSPKSCVICRRVP